MFPVKRILCLASLALFLKSSDVSSATITVAKNGADFSTITAAIKAAQPGDVIKIMDTQTYEEQVTFDSSKYPLTLTSKDPAALTKPTIKYRDTIHVGPRTAAESRVDSLITFDQNGALQILGARNVIIDGIAVDGGGVYPFGYPAIWEGRYGIQHGNGAIAFWQAGNVIIRNCDISNAYFGINVKDRNTGGIYFMPNPADNDTTVYVPLSKFGHTGNHLIERNRIHNNSWGMFFESAWDHGSTVRYNLIFDNHHPTEAIATAVYALTTDEGPNQSGGALFFKDNELSPLAIYNNTFYHNFALFAGHWQAGYHHLVFNNIFGPPFKYLQNSTPQFTTTVMELTSVLTNRIYSCIYSAQAQAPQANYVNVMDSLPLLQGTGGMPPDPGTLIPGTVIAGSTRQRGFPATAANRWLEMDSSLFLSINPTSANFLEPNWANESVKSFIVNQGWEKSGVKNTDGSRADLGAIEQVHGAPSFVATIQPGPLPIILNGANTQITFLLNERMGTTLVDPQIKLFRLIRTNYVKGPFGNGEKTMVISPADMTVLTVPPTPPVKVGPNSYSFNTTISGDFGFIEMIIEATGADGKFFTTAAGFLPYRKMDYAFKVEVFDKAGKIPLTVTHVGDTALLKISPQKINGEAFSNKINTVRLTTQSGYSLVSPGNPAQLVEFPNGVAGPIEKPVMFTKIPENGYECISVAGYWRNPTTYNTLLFFGGATIKVLPLGAALAVNKSPLAFKQTNNPSNEMTITCFDLQGRKIFQKTFFTDNGTTIASRYLQKKIPGAASKVFLMDISVKDRVSLKQTRSVRKIVTR